MEIFPRDEGKMKPFLFVFLDQWQRTDIDGALARQNSMPRRQDSMQNLAGPYLHQYRLLAAILYIKM